MRAKTPPTRPLLRRFRVFYTGGLNPYRDVDAPNKELARALVARLLNPGHRIFMVSEVKRR